MVEQKLAYKQLELDPAHNEQDRLKIVRASHELSHMLRAKGIDPNTVLLRGTSRTEQVTDGSEFDQTDSKNQLFFGTIEDTLPLGIDTSSPEANEQAEEAWMVNPLKYALEQGALRIYDRDKITVGDYEQDEQFGTVVASMPVDEARRAERPFSDYNVITNPPSARMSEEQYAGFDTTDVERTIQQLKEAGIQVDSGIVRIDVVGQTGDTVESHYYNTSTQNNGNNFGDRISRVLEIGREYEAGEDPYITEELGDRAIEAVGIETPEEVAPLHLSEVEVVVSESHEKPAISSNQLKDTLAAYSTLRTLLGENRKGGGLLGDALKEYAGAEAKNSQLRELLDAQNGDKELRQQARTILRNRLEQLTGQNPPLFGYDVENDNEKAVPQNFDYDESKMLSRDYVAALALAKLDGSFDVSKGEFFSAKTDGQHRKAAELLLKSFADERIADTPEADDTNLDDEAVRELNQAYTQSREAWINQLMSATHATEMVRGIVFQNFLETNDVEQGGEQIVSLLTDMVHQLEYFSSRILQSEVAQRNPGKVEDANYRVRQWQGQLDELASRIRVIFVDTLRTDQSLGTINQIRAYLNRDWDQIAEGYNKIRSELMATERIL